MVHFPCHSWTHCLHRLSLLGAVLVINISFGCAAQNENEKPRECRVTIGTGSVAVQLVVSDPELIKELFEEPLSNARIDPSPAFYVAIGWIELVRKDGSAEHVTLFAGWRHHARGDKYFIGDFSKLMKKFKEEIKKADQLLVD